MADKWPLANGNWSNAANWNGGAKPAISDDVYADGYTVTIDESVNVGSLRTTQRSGGTAGGGFSLNANCNITCTDILAGTSHCLTVNCAGSGNTVTANVKGSDTTTAKFGINFTGSAPLTHSGTCRGGVVNTGSGIVVSCTSSITQVGNCYGGLGFQSHGLTIGLATAGTVTGTLYGGGGGYSQGVSIAQSTPVSIIGDCYGGATGNDQGLYHAAASDVTVTGNGYGVTGTGIYNYSTGKITVSGNAQAGASGYGALNNSSGTLIITGQAIGASTTIVCGLYGVAATGITKYGSDICGSNGVHGAGGFCRMISTATGYIERLDANGTRQTFVLAASVNNPPAASDVRYGVSYTTGGGRVGTCRVPSADSVAYGVHVDATTGTAVLTQANVVSAVTAVIAAAVSGSGARTVTVTVNDGTDPLEGATVRLSKGAESYTQRSDSDGECVFNIDDGTWLVAITMAGYSFSGDTLSVDGDEAATFSMTPYSITPPASPNLTSGYVLCLGIDGLPEAGVKIYAQLTSGPGDDGYALDTETFMMISDTNGVAQYNGFVTGAKYRFRRGKSNWSNPSTVPDAVSWSIDEVLGIP